MRYLLASVVVATGLAMSPAVFAASQTATGAIKSIDASAHSIVLANGMKYALPTNFNAKSLKAGERVQISWTMKGKDHAATSVKVLN